MPRDSLVLSKDSLKLVELLGCAPDSLYQIQKYQDLSKYEREYGLVKSEVASACFTKKLRVHLFGGNFPPYFPAFQKYSVKNAIILHNKESFNLAMKRYSAESGWYFNQQFDPSEFMFIYNPVMLIDCSPQHVFDSINTYDPALSFLLATRLEYLINPKEPFSITLYE